MILGSAPYMINLILTLKPMDTLATKQSTKKRSFLPILGMTAELGFMGYWALNTATKSVPNTAGIIAGLLTSLAVSRIIQKTGKEKLGDWVLGIALIGGMVVATIVDSLVK
jgi:hypothetical protein